MSGAFDPLTEEDDDLEPLDELQDGELPPVTTEERARAMGWKPLPTDPARPQRDEYRGDPRRWTDAETFIAHGEAELPILRDQNRRMSERLARTDTEMAALRNTVTEQADAVTAAMNLARRANEQGYQRALSELKARQREAVTAGDEVAFDQIEEQITALEETREEVAASPPPPPPPPASPPPPPAEGPKPEIQAFVRANPWFNDPARKHLQTAMIGMHNAVIAEHPSMALADQLEEALIRMEGAFPEILEEPMPAPRQPPRRRAAAPSALEPSRPMGRRPTNGGSPIDRITDPAERAEARSAYNAIKRADPDMSEDEYMTIYDDPHVDTIELLRNRKKK